MASTGKKSWKRAGAKGTLRSGRTPPKPLQPAEVEHQERPTPHPSREIQRRRLVPATPPGKVIADPTPTPPAKIDPPGEDDEG
jgi:hypothetical protein